MASALLVVSLSPRSPATSSVKLRRFLQVGRDLPNPVHKTVARVPLPGKLVITCTTKGQVNGSALPALAATVARASRRHPAANAHPRLKLPPVRDRPCRLHLFTVQSTGEERTNPSSLQSVVPPAKMKRKRPLRSKVGCQLLQGASSMRPKSSAETVHSQHHLTLGYLMTTMAPLRGTPCPHTWPITDFILYSLISKANLRTSYHCLHLRHPRSLRKSTLVTTPT